jgi:DNA-binding SARP family transcriptional activator
MDARYDEAIESLRKLISNDPKNYRLYIELSQCHQEAGDKQRALEALVEFQRLGIRNAHIQDLVSQLSH